MSLRCALAGNPNAGKTTLFNELTGSTAHVGNWPGVTVERKTGFYKKNIDQEIEIIDLPGIYSLTPYSPEEKVASEYIAKEKPDVIINIVDATNIERNLYLTSQLMDTGIPVVVALNMMDEVESIGDSIDIDKLSAGLGIPVVPIVAIRKKNIETLMKKVYETIKLGESYPMVPRSEMDDAIAGEEDQYEKEAIVADLRYKAISRIVNSSVHKSEKRENLSRSDKIDRVLTHRVWAIPIFIVIMLLIFQVTFGDPLIPGTEIPSPGVWIQGGVETFMEWLSGTVEGAMESAGAASWAKAIVIGGLLNGVGSVLSFVPQILLLFFFMAILEGSGYMARAAFIMDRILRRFGLSGKAFVPMLMGFGCSVPGIMATRTLENEQDRRLTIILTPFMSCGAKLPIYAVFAGALFAKNSGLVIASLYFLGIIVAVLSAIILKKTLFKGQAAPFIMELPQYRMPTFKNLMSRMWEKGKGFIIRAGTIILASVVIISLLQNFNWSFQVVENTDLSIIASIGRVIKPIFTPVGFATWQAAVAILTGFLAKENVVATLGTLYGTGDAIEENEALLTAIASAFTPLAAYSFMAFNLLAMPCMAAVGTIRKEMNSWKWTLFTIFYQTGIAYIVSLLIYQIGRLIGLS